LDASARSSLHAAVRQPATEHGGADRGGLADWGFGRLNDLKVPLNVSFGVFASFCIISVFIVLMIRPRENAG
jgi:hypothetical protein